MDLEGEGRSKGEEPIVSFFFALEVNCSLEIKHPASGGGGWEDEEEEVGGLQYDLDWQRLRSSGRPTGGAGGRKPGGEVLFSSCQLGGPPCFHISFLRPPPSFPLSLPQNFSRRHPRTALRPFNPSSAQLEDVIAIPRPQGQFVLTLAKGTRKSSETFFLL